MSKLIISILISLFALFYAADIAYSQQDSSLFIFTYQEIIPIVSAADIEQMGKNTIVLDCAPLQNTKPPLYLINGKIFSPETLNDLKVEQIDSISVLENEIAVKKYGNAGKNGAVLIKVSKKYFDILIKIREEKKKTRQQL